MVRRARVYGPVKTLRIYRALRRKGVAVDKARAIAGAAKTPARRSQMVRKGNQHRRRKRR